MRRTSVAFGTSKSAPRRRAASSRGLAAPLATAVIAAASKARSGCARPTAKRSAHPALIADSAAASASALSAPPAPPPLAGASAPLPLLLAPPQPLAWAAEAAAVAAAGCGRLAAAVPGRRRVGSGW